VQRDLVQELIHRGAAVREDAHAFICFCRLGDGGVGHAVLRHHASHQQLGDLMLRQHLRQSGLDKTVGKVFHHHRRFGGGRQNARVDVRPFGPLIEKRREPHGGVCDVLDVDDHHALRLRAFDGRDDVAGHGLGVPQRVLPTEVIVVLQIDQEEGFGHGGSVGHVFMGRVV